MSPSPNTTPAASAEALSTLNATSVASWQANAAFWDAHMGDDGNEFFNVLEAPAVTRLSAVRPGDRVLDLATGTGLLARRLAGLGAVVTATDASRNLIDIAERRTVGDLAASITFGLLDVTRDADFDRLVGECEKHGGFDTVTMNMAIMDVPTLGPLVAALPRLLKENGKFVASVCHPVFFSSGASRHIELGEDQATGRLGPTHSMRISRYLHIPPARGEALPGQPAVQLYFHRSFQDLFGPFFQAGFKLDGLVEPAFTLGPNEKKIQSYHNFPQIPPVLVFRMTL